MLEDGVGEVADSVFAASIRFVLGNGESLPLGRSCFHEEVLLQLFLFSILLVSIMVVIFEERVL